MPTGEIKSLQFSELTSVSVPAVAATTVGDPTLPGHAINGKVLRIDQTTVSGIRAITSDERLQFGLVSIGLGDNAVIYQWQPSNSNTDDGDEYLKPDDIVSGPGRWRKLSGGGAGGGTSIQNVLRGEAINTDNRAVYLHEKQSLVVDTSNDQISFNEGSGELQASVANGIYLLDTTENIAELTDAIAAALNSAGGGGITWSASFNEVTRTFSISSSGSASILWKTGVSGSDNDDDHIGTLLGFDDTADDTLLTNFPADNDIDTAGTIIKKVFAFKTDADDEAKSKSAIGLMNQGSKSSTGFITPYGQISAYGSNLQNGSYFTKSAAIVITATNSKINFKEDGGSELTATLSSNSYESTDGYANILSEIKTQLETSGTGTYSVTYDNDTDKFTISVSGSVAAVQFLPATGTDSANEAMTSLGFDGTDTASQASHVSDNELDLKGILQFETETNEQYAVPLGLNTSDSDLFVKRKANIEYLDMVRHGNSWLSDNTSLSTDIGSEWQLLDEDQTPDGKGARIYYDNAGTASEAYQVKLKNGHGAQWYDVTFNISTNTAGASYYGENFTGGSGNLGSSGAYIKRDPDNPEYIVVIANINDGVNNGLRIYTSEDSGVNWTLRVDLVGTGINYGISTIDIRDNRACCGATASNSSTTKLYGSKNLGSGYTSWTLMTFPSTWELESDAPAAAVIQSFPAASGNAKYRFSMYGRNRVTGGVDPGAIVGSYFDDAFTHQGNNNLLTGDKYLWGLCRDRKGTGNVISAMIVDTARTIFTESYSNDSDSSLTFTTGSDRWSGTAESTYEWSQTVADFRTIRFHLKRRMVLLGNKAFVLACDASLNLKIMYADSLSGGTWGEFSVASNVTEKTIHWIPSDPNFLIVLYKQNSTPASNFTRGAIFYQKVRIDATGLTLIGAAQQIDDGTSEATKFKGYLCSSESATVCTLGYEQFNSGSGRDFMESQKFV